MSAGDIHSLLFREDEPLFNLQGKPKITPQPKIRRYWPGKAPDYATEEIEEENNNEILLEPDLENYRIKRLHAVNNDSKVSAGSRDRSVINYTNEAPPTVAKVDFEVKITEQIVNEESPEDRRLRLKKEILQKRKEEEQLLSQKHDMFDEFDEEDSDEEGESEEDDPSNLPLLKPVFVPKSRRDTIKEKEELEIEEQKKQEIVQHKLQEKKVESQKIASDLAKQEIDVIPDAINDIIDRSDTEMPDDDDEENEAEEYEAWKLRETIRLKREKEERDQRANFVSEIERRHNLTEEERLIENQKIDQTIPKKEKKYKQLFMQKYYHKGAFFQDKAQAGEENIYLRDFHAPVGEDTMDKKILPKAMRLRRGQFGRAGQVKHTHLVDVDTTDLTALQYRNGSISHKYKQKMAGLKSEKQFDRPGKKQK